MDHQLKSFLLLITLFFIDFMDPVSGRGPKVTHRVTFDISHGGQNVGQIKLDMYGGTVPTQSTTAFK